MRRCHGDPLPARAPPAHRCPQGGRPAQDHGRAAELQRPHRRDPHPDRGHDVVRLCLRGAGARRPAGCPPVRRPPAAHPVAQPDVHPARDAVRDHGRAEHPGQGVGSPRGPDLRRRGRDLPRGGADPGPPRGAGPGAQHAPGQGREARGRAGAAAAGAPASRPSTSASGGACPDPPRGARSGPPSRRPAPPCGGRRPRRPRRARCAAGPTPARGSRRRWCPRAR